MRVDWTPAVVRALELGQGQARGAGMAQVLPIHLLHGLLAEEEGRAAVLAVAAGLVWAQYRNEVSPGIAGSANAELPLHGETRDVLQRARELASELTGERTVAGDVLLLALVREAQDVVQFLKRFGFSAARLQADLEATRIAPLDLDEPLRIGRTTEEIDLARVIDACANRAREGLRVAEDYCRFVLDDAFLCRELKSLRHGLTEILAEFSADRLLAGRETEADVGTGISTPSEQRRQGLLEVAQANLKRLQEALRSLEEFGKIQSAQVGAALQHLRYRTYTLERAIVLGDEARQRLAHARLYVLLSAGQCNGPLKWTIEQAAAGGAHIVQLREKNLDDRGLLARAREVRRWTRDAGVLFIVNDRPDVARLVEADGVHLGQADMPVKDARRIVGADAIIGVSTHTIEQVRQAVLDGASYIGVGPTFPSTTKDFTELAGLDFVREVMAETTLPAFVLGGVTLDNIGEAVAAGAKRVAVSAAVGRAEDPRMVAAQLAYAIDGVLARRASEG